MTDVWRAGRWRPSVVPIAAHLQIGVHAVELPIDGYAVFARGTNGGRRRFSWSAWTEFDRCRAEPETGFREVYFEYDNELELWATGMNSSRGICRAKSQSRERQSSTRWRLRPISSMLSSMTLISLAPI